MNYTKLYSDLVERGRKELRSKGGAVYYERHHIQPRCLGGSSDPHNLVLLTAREHFLAHWLLTRIYPTSRLLVYAFNCFCLTGYPVPRPCSHLYKYAREKYVRLLKSTYGWRAAVAATLRTKVWVKDVVSGDCLRIPESAFAEFEALGYTRGRSFHHRRPHSLYMRTRIGRANAARVITQQSRDKHSGAAKGRIWLNNGKVCRFVVPTEVPALCRNGWVRGRINDAGRELIDRIELPLFLNELNEE